MTAQLRRSVRFLLVSALLGAGCNPEPEVELQHGVVKLEFRVGAGEDNPFAGATRLLVRLDYLECLTNFYERNPAYTADGPEGALVFGTSDDGGEGWADRLCDTDDAEFAACTVESFDQNVTTASHLAVMYTIEGDLRDRLLQFGPLPKAELAACDGGLAPTVRVGAGAVRGLSGDGQLIFEEKSVNPTVADTNQGQAIRINVGVPE